MGRQDMNESHNEEAFMQDYKARSYSAQQPSTPFPSNRYRYKAHNSNNPAAAAAAAQAKKVEEDANKEEFSTAISWPIFLAIIPTLGAFIAGSAEVWSDFIMVLLILYYVYKWITVPWSYYESARSRRMIHQFAAHRQQNTASGLAGGEGLDSNNSDHNNKKRREYSLKRQQSVEEELRRHELVGLAWVILSPAVAGYTLQYSRYFLSNYDRYMSTFNVTVFTIAATIKPLIHVAALLRERTLFLQSEIQVNESEIDVLQKKLEMVEEELDGLRKAFATKKDLGQVANGITPGINQLSKAIKKFEKKESSLRSWSEDRFQEIDQKVQDFDQFICYSIEQDQKKSAQRLFVTLMFLPINLTFWAAKRMTALLPIPRAILGFTGTSSKPTPSIASSSYRYRSRHLTHPDLQQTATNTASASSVHSNRALFDQSEKSCSGEESIPNIGQRHHF